MNCPVCQALLEHHTAHEANICATALDQRINHVRSKTNEQINGWESAARVLRRRIVRDGSFT